MLPGLNQITENWQDNLTSKIYEGLLIFPAREEYLQEKFKHTRESNMSQASKSRSSSLSILSSSSGSVPLQSSTERFEYFSELFRSFLIDINPSQLRAFKISYKYSRVKTAEFEIELVEVLNYKEELAGPEFLRELLNELTNLAEIYQLLEEQSPLSQHLYRLEDSIDQQNKTAAEVEKHSGEKKDADYIELQMKSSEPLRTEVMESAHHQTSSSFDS